MVLLLIRQSSLSFRVSFFFTLLLLSSFHVFVSVSVSNSSIPRDESTGVKEANALLKWKASLDHQSQSVLSSWVGNDTCYWIGIICDKSGRVSHLNLSNSGLIGNLTNLSFLYLFRNKLSGAIPQQVGMLKSQQVSRCWSFFSFSGPLFSRRGILVLGSCRTK
ncbi:PREDICTED: probable leucine-rich repeat receptor-like protein kinase At1g35710 isoform X1 [Theobroma cacao]|uniref:Probable leucine-rich repeat receptor-like protein kinase At1g35710 isoform X1 n=1 Tax=Theobroma cacao TaxID=3641 RepID=A0AB32WVV5_THECC|nr:PREDICTED: probable leucine-rich repeat receptor-like protein kinase At1g35710 isoform X1 [Theobroma cacao]